MGASVQGVQQDFIWEYHDGYGNVGSGGKATKNNVGVSSGGIESEIRQELPLKDCRHNADLLENSEDDDMASSSAAASIKNFIHAIQLLLSHLAPLLEIRPMPCQSSFKKESLIKPTP